MKKTINYLNFIKERVRGHAIVYALPFIGFILYVVISAFVAIQTPIHSDIPAYNLDKINDVNKSLSQRRQLEKTSTPGLSQIDFGKNEPFR